MVFFIAEIGVNHNGDMDLARKLIDASVDAGAHAAKFQTFTAERTITKGTKTVAYQKDNAGEDDQHAMLKKLELAPEVHGDLRDYCDRLGIEFMSTAFDREALAFLVELGIKRIKIPSGELTNTPFLRDCASYELPVILSTGMASMEEVVEAVALIQGYQTTNVADDGSPMLTVLHCTSAYPAPFADCNLRAIATLSEKFSIPVGYSDHSSGIALAPAAVALGATLIEKHITLDRNLAGPDHAASIEPNELQQMIEHVNAVEQALGDGVKAPRGSEPETAKLVRRGLKAGGDLPAGHVLSENDIAILRPETGLAPSQLEVTLGRQLAQDVSNGDPITTDVLKSV